MSFSRYPEYEDSGVEWIGELPKHWPAVTFRRLVTITEGQVDPRKVENSALPLIAPNHIEGGTGRLLVLESAEDQAAESGKYEVRQGDIVYSKIRPSLRKVCVAPTDGLCSADMYPLRPQQGLDGRFLFWWLLSEPFSAYAVLESDRVAMPKINRDGLNSTYLPLPSIAEQRGIANFLDRETAKIDALVAEQERLIALLKEKRHAVISHAVAKGLNPDAPMKDSGAAWLGLVPAHWHVLPLKHVLAQRPIYGVLVPDSDMSGVPMLRITDMSDGIADREALARISSELSAQYQRTIVEAGDLVLSVVGTIGETLLVDERLAGINLSRALCKLRTAESLSAKFLQWFFRSTAFVHFVDLVCTGTAQRVLNMDDLGELWIPVPPKDEQQRISESLAGAWDSLGSLIQEVSRSLELLKGRRSSLVTAAVTGQIDVRGLAPAEAA